MRISSLILLFCCSVFFAAAQKKYQDTYYYTQASEKYFTDGEIDSLFRTAIENIFSQNAVPVSLLDKHYITVKSILAGAVRNNLIVSFKERKILTPIAGRSNMLIIRNYILTHL